MRLTVTACKPRVWFCSKKQFWFYINYHKLAIYLQPSVNYGKIPIWLSVGAFCQRKLKAPHSHTHTFSAEIYCILFSRSLDTFFFGQKLIFEMWSCTKWLIVVRKGIENFIFWPCQTTNKLSPCRCWWRFCLLLFFSLFEERMELILWRWFRFSKYERFSNTAWVGQSLVSNYKCVPIMERWFVDHSLPLSPLHLELFNFRLKWIGARICHE